MVLRYRKGWCGKCIKASSDVRVFGLRLEEMCQIYRNMPFPCPWEQRVGGHIIVALGYDDKVKIKSLNGEIENTGALLISKERADTG